MGREETMRKTWQIHSVYGTLVFILLGIIALLAWQLLGYSMMHQRNVDYCSELAFAYGYSVGRDEDIEKTYPRFHHRLTNMAYKDKILAVEIWPAKNKWLFFYNPRSDGENGGMVDCAIGEKAKGNP